MRLVQKVSVKRGYRNFSRKTCRSSLPPSAKLLHYSLPCYEGKIST